MNRTHSAFGRLTALFVTVAILFASGGCGDDASPRPEGKPTIAVTIYPIANLVDQLVGDAAEVVCLLPAGQSPHHAELTASKRAAIDRASVIIAVGFGLDAWIGRAEPAADNAVTVLRCANLLGLAVDTGDENEHAHAHDDHGHGHGHGHNHEHEHDYGTAAQDPHVWTDPVLAIELVIDLGNALQERLPDHASAIAANAEALVDELRGLDAAYRERLAPFKGEPLVTYHSAFNRLADRYGLVVAATLAPAETPGAMTVEARRQAATVIEAHGLRAIFAEPQFPPAATEAMKREMGVEVITLDPLGDPNDPQRATYQKMMRFNLNQLVRGLQLNTDADN